MEGDFALQQQVSSPTGPASSLTSKRLARRFPRPSTAPETDDKSEFLPSMPSGHPLGDPNAPTSPVEFSPDLGYVPRLALGKRPGAFSRMQTVDEDDSYAISETTQGVSHLGTLPSPFRSSDVGPAPSSPGDHRSDISESDYDWATFMTAYASGRWDPHRTPNPPRPYTPAPNRAHASYTKSEPTISTLQPAESIRDGPSLNSDTQTPSQPEGPVSKLSYPSIAATTGDPVPLDKQPSSSIPSPSTSLNKFRPTESLKLPLPSLRLRSSFSGSPVASNSNCSDFSDPPKLSPSFSNPDLQTTAAAMRWAAVRVNIAPLTLPSPEHELTDPMRGVTTAIPGSHAVDLSPGPDIWTPGGTRKTRLTSFWQGTQDVNYTTEGRNGRLETIEGSPSDNSTHYTSYAPVTTDATSSNTGHLNLLSSTFPASVPVMHASNQPEIGSDYFGRIDPILEEPARESPVISIRSPSSELGTMSVPALPRRVCLTRQTSSPLPISTSREAVFPSGRIRSESMTSVKAGRSAKEEQMFAELGYLAPPNPPDELERRRALHKFNIWNTGPDLNFDRIAHLVKLVFNTKGVFISLIDGNEQWFKSEWGIQMQTCPRVHSFCAHTILQRGDEPMVVLDTLSDWRFAKNPLVTGPPNIRFYTGAPLRTQDGFNIGSLSVLDDAPREDFTPRQRHTLKEFAAIAMREMELWRDKIQLRIRDRIQNSMEQFSRECLEIDTEAQAQNKEDRPELFVGASMDKVYDRAAKLVKRTLDVEGVIVMDVSHCDVLESRNAEGSVSVVMYYGDPQIETTTRALSIDEYEKMNAFFTKYPDGKISEGFVPPSFRPFLPTHIQYALTVPIFNIDKRPFALLCAYNASDHTTRFLEGHELSYLRAIGVIILSAVLKRRMILADKAKSLFISNISHELRTPLHGILAAAELLSESSLNHSQLSFLQTIQACGTSLVETVNHVLDFTKLSGNSKSGGVETVILPTKVDLMHLVEEAVDGCWIGHRARTAILRDSGIGSVYSPPKEEQGSSRRIEVEGIVDVGFRKGGWVLKCEKGGIRRVLMNLFGNSLKFTTDGFVHVKLRELQPSEDIPRNKIKIELSVTDTGKGISQNFLKNQLFHPFSQENPLQTGTGLGLAIVNGIVQSESVGGKVDVWSEEGTGTEIKVVFFAETPEEDNEGPSLEMEPFKFSDLSRPPTVSLAGFDPNIKGVRLLSDVIRNYLVSWWGFEVLPDGGDIIILNDDPTPVLAATGKRDTGRPFIILSNSRGNPNVMVIASEYERIGGFCRIVYKPGGPSRLRSVLKLCLHALKIGSQSRSSSSFGENIDSPNSPPNQDEEVSNDRAASYMPRRNSEESRVTHVRPVMAPRSSTTHPSALSWNVLTPTTENDSISTPPADGIANSMISVGSGGSLLETSVCAVDAKRQRYRVLVVEDNTILRNLLVRWLTTKGYDFRDAVDGRHGVNVFEQDGPFDVVLLDLSMPVLDGVGATAEIRRIESARGKLATGATPPSSRILALTGMSGLEDKRRAFEAGVDGYLVKPVAFKTLDQMFHKLGIS